MKTMDSRIELEVRDCSVIHKSCMDCSSQAQIDDDIRDTRTLRQKVRDIFYHKHFILYDI